MKPYPEIPDGLVVEHDGPVLRLRLDRPDRRNSAHRPDRLRARRHRRRGRHRRVGPGDPPDAVRATTSAPASTSANERRTADTPRVGSIHRRMSGHVNRLIPAMLDDPDADRVHGPTGGSSASDSTWRWRRTSRSSPTTPGSGRRSPRSGSRPTAPHRGSSPASWGSPGPGRC